MAFRSDKLLVATPGRGIYDITRDVARIVRTLGLSAGLANVFVHHTSASLVISENADASVRHDLETFFARLVPDGDPMFTHDAEGPDDMPAHVRAILTQTSLTIPVLDGQLALGTWQGIYLWEHRGTPHERRITVSVLS